MFFLNLIIMTLAFKIAECIFCNENRIEDILEKDSTFAVF